MASKEQTVVSECACQLRRMGDMINWKYVLLHLIARNYKPVVKIK
ncbi:phorbol-12-myristate-13-acetate-induced protein 1 [Electrophorus electricus]|nr:phorbol-12-myristate-13-acetate-induced protein 1 [Electrophorus electricus]